MTRRRFEDPGPDLPRAALDLLLFAALAFVFLVLVAALQPRVATVWREWPSGRCVRVLDHLPEGDCGDLPRVHDTVWVAPGGGLEGSPPGPGLRGARPAAGSVGSPLVREAGACARVPARRRLETGGGGEVVSDNIFSRFYTTTSDPDDRRVRDGCGHLHARAAAAVACALRRGDFPVVVDRAGKSVLRMDSELDEALAEAVGSPRGRGGVAP